MMERSASSRQWRRRGELLSGAVKVHQISRYVKTDAVFVFDDSFDVSQCSIITDDVHNVFPVIYSDMLLTSLLL